MVENPYDPPNEYNCHNTLSEAWREGQQEGYARGIQETSKGGWQGTAQEWREEIISLLKTYRGIEAICPKCSGWGRRTYANTSTWRHGIGGQQLTSGLCDGCWGSGDAERKWVSPIEIEAKIKAAKQEGLAQAESLVRQREREIVEWVRSNKLVAKESAYGEHEKFYMGQVVLCECLEAWLNG